MIGRQSRIVVADGEMSSRKTLGGFLLERGYSVALAATDDEALRLVAEEASDALLVDLTIARMGRHGLLARMRSGFPAVAIAVITEPSDLRSAIESLRQGANAYFLKPLDRNELHALVERMLGKRRAGGWAIPQQSGSGVTVPGSSLEDIERHVILKTLEACGGSTSKAAGMLRISSRTIQYKLKQYRTEGGIT